MLVAARQGIQYPEMTPDGLIALMSCHWQQIEPCGHVVSVVSVVSKQKGA